MSTLISTRPTAIATPMVPPPPRPSVRPPRGAPLAGAIRVLAPACCKDAEAISAIVLGRDATCDVVCDDALSSRRHARIIVLQTAVLLEDLGSTNGVYLNGMRLEKRAALHAGDRIVIGTSELSVFSPRRP